MVLTEIDNTSVISTSTQRIPPPPGSSSPPVTCTGCVIQGYQPTIVAFQEADSSLWTSVQDVTTVLAKEIKYYTGTPGTLQTIVTEFETISHTTTFIGAYGETITHTTPVLTIEPTPGVTLELPVGTYLFYDKIYGGLNVPSSAGAQKPVTYSVPQMVTYLPPRPITQPSPRPTTYSKAKPPPLVHYDYISGQVFRKRNAQPTCTAALEVLDIAPVRTEDWHYFYQTITAGLGHPTPTALPRALLRYLNQVPDIQSVFGSSNISSCTPISTPVNPETPTSVVQESSVYTQPHQSMVPPPYYSVPTRTRQSSTYIETTYQTETTETSVSGCYRCDVQYSTPVSPSNKKDTEGKNPHGPAQPGSPVKLPSSDQPGGAQIIPIGGVTHTIRPAKPTKVGQGYGTGQNVVVGTLTLTPGQTTTMNNVPVAVPTAGGGALIVAGTNTYKVLPTGAPFISVGKAALAPNSRGQYLVGSQTLLPGGSPITVNGYTMSLGSHGGSVVINGITQTLGNSPMTTEAPVIRVGDQPYTATVIDGITQFLIGPGQTLLPGSALTISGTTYSMPSDASGTIVVINGVTSTLGLGPITAAPDITIAGNTYAATVRDGTTEYVLGKGTTLRPGDIITVSGTMYSLDELGTALLIDGRTSTISKTPAKNSATPTASASSTDLDGEGKFVETGAVSTSSKAGAISIRRTGLDAWMESIVVALASWLFVFM